MSQVKSVAINACIMGLNCCMKSIILGYLTILINLTDK